MRCGVYQQEMTKEDTLKLSCNVVKAVNEGEWKVLWNRAGHAVGAVVGVENSVMITT